MKILCIDGGGIRGVFAISILQAMEEEFGSPIGECFDLIAGTSTGSIIAAQAVMKKDMKELLMRYKENGFDIFRKKSKVGFFKSIYTDEFLREMLQEAFGETKLGDLCQPLILPAADLTNGNPYVHRSNYGHPDAQDSNVFLWDAILSSCSAPVYFPPNNIGNQYLSIDGGLWANNPSMVCIIEAISFFKRSLDEIQILSIGTGKQSIDFSIEQNKFWGIRKWLPFQFPSFKITPKLIDLAVDLSSESVTYQCHHLLANHYLRLNKVLGKEMPFDEVGNMEILIRYGRQTFEENIQEIKVFLNK